MLGLKERGIAYENPHDIGAGIHVFICIFGFIIGVFFQVYGSVFNPTIFEAVVAFWLWTSVNSQIFYF